KLDVNADFLYAKYDADRSRAWAGIILEKTLDKYVPESIVVDDHDARIAGSLVTKVENSHERYLSEETFLTGGINATWYANSGATVFVEYGRSNSRAQRDQMVMQTYTKGPGGAGVPVDFDLRGADIPSVTIPDLTDPADFVGQGFYDD